jgi:predicted AlkP superfamily phosphohydrolase/phosphomutase
MLRLTSRIRSRRSASGRPAERNRRHHPGAAVGAASALVTLGVVLAALSGGCGGGPSSDMKVVVLGIDGMDWQLIDPLLEQGKLPNLAGLIERGVRSDFRSLEPDMKSPIIWTTIATGKGPRKHGISDFIERGGEERLLNSEAWLVRPIWDILSEKGYTVGTINWLLSWPAQPVNGYNVSDRIMYATDEDLWPVERATYPEELAAEVVANVRSMHSVTDDELAPLLNGDAWRGTSNLLLEEAVEHLRNIYGIDRTITDAATYLLDTKEQPDFFAVYMNGIDMACHFFWGHMDPSSLAIKMDEETVETCCDVIPRYYERMDAMIGEILERLDEDSTIILCSDHGFRGPYRSPMGLRLGIWMHRPLGVIVAAGPGTRTGAELSDASVFDVTPTVLALLGEPVARDMDGFVLSGLISEERLSAAPVTYIDTYETGSAPDAELGDMPAETAVDERIKERLMSVGYID